MIPSYFSPSGIKCGTANYESIGNSTDDSRLSCQLAISVLQVLEIFLCGTIKCSLMVNTVRFVAMPTRVILKTSPDILICTFQDVSEKISGLKNIFIIESTCCQPCATSAVVEFHFPHGHSQSPASFRVLFPFLP